MQVGISSCNNKSRGPIELAIACLDPTEEEIYVRFFGSRTERGGEWEEGVVKGLRLGNVPPNEEEIGKGTAGPIGRNETSAAAFRDSGPIRTALANH